MVNRVDRRVPQRHCAEVTELAALGREALRLAARDPAAAQALAETVIEQARDCKAWEVIAVGERALGVAAMTLNHIDPAVSHLRTSVKAGQRSGQAHVIGEARMSLASALALRGVPAQAARQIGLAVRQLDGTAAARARVQRAAILQEAGRDAEALEDLRRAVPVLRRARDAEWLVRALTNRSLLHVGRRAFAAAEADLGEALALAHDHALGLPAAYVEHNLGYVKAQRGDIPAALRLFDAANRSYRRFGVVEPGLLLDRAGVLLSVRLLTEAAATLEEAVHVYQDGHREVHLPEAQLMLSTVSLLQGDGETAVEAARQAVKGFRRYGHRHSLALAHYAALQAAYQCDPRSVAPSHLARVADRLDEAGWTVPALEARVAAGRQALERGDPVVARRHLARAGRARVVGPADARARAWYAEALLRRSLGQRRAAYCALRAGLRIVEDYQATLGATELRAHVSIHRGALARMGVAMSIEDHNARRALSWAERGRGMALLMRPAEPSSDPEVAQDLADLRSTVAEIEEVRKEGKPGEASLMRRQVTLEHRIRNRCLSLDGDAGLRRRVRQDPAQAVSQVLGDSALVEFLEVGDALHAVTVADGRVALHHLGAVSQVGDSVQFLGFALHRLAATRSASKERADSARDALGKAANRLDEQLLRPLARRIGDRPLVVVPSPALQSLPWSVLPSCVGRPLTANPSATLWTRAMQTPRPDRARRVVVAGPDLPGATREAQVIAGIYGQEATLLEGRDATCAQTEKALAGAAMLHLACHGRLRADNPLFSSLLLADGPLTVYELERLQDPPHQVVLAGCDTGKVHLVAGEEVLGLAAALLGSGTSTLIASVVPVPDLATVELMQRYHQALVRGLTPAAALANAQTQVDDDPAALVASAGFICMGAG